MFANREKFIRILDFIAVTKFKFLTQLKVQ